MAIELRHLRYFIAVAESGNISQAAQKLFIAQPPLSAQIKQLEDEVGAPLLKRLPRGVALTPAGESFLADARAILARSQDATLRAREMHEGQAQIIRMGLMPSSTHALLPSVMQAIGQRKLQIQLQVREISPSSVQLQALRNAEIDLGLIRLGVEDIPSEACAAMDDPYCLAIPASHPLARSSAPLDLSKAAKEPFVNFSSHHQSDYFDQTMALCVEAGFRPEVRHVAGQFAGVLSMVACGLGVAIVPASCFDSQDGMVRRRLTGSRYRSQLVLISRQGDAKSPSSTPLSMLSAVVANQLKKLAKRTQNALA